MNFRDIFYVSDKRLRVPWRIIIFISLLLLAISPLLLLEKSIFQFSGASIILVIGIFINSKLLDKRPFLEYGLKLTKQSLRHLLIGNLIGLLSVFLIFITGIFGGIISVAEEKSIPDLTILILFGIKTILVAIVEESLYRGYLFTNLKEAFQTSWIDKRISIVGAIVASSVLFGAAHLGNENASFTSFLFLTLNGVVWCIPFILTNNLGFSIGLHTSWNFFQYFFGFTMSGNKATNSIFIVESTAHKIWSGGEYGPEAGLLGVLGFASMLFFSVGYLKKTKLKV